MSDEPEVSPPLGPAAQDDADEVALAVQIALELRRQRAATRSGPALRLVEAPAPAEELLEDPDLDEGEEDQANPPLSMFARFRAGLTNMIYAYARAKLGIEAGKEHQVLTVIVTAWLCGLLAGLLVGISA